MAKIHGLADNMTLGQLEEDVRKGGRFVCYQYCVSIVVMTFTRSSGIHYIPRGKSAVGAGMGFTLLSLVAGWWGFPWGFIRTPMVLATNLGGGKDVTPEIMQHFRYSMGVAAPQGSADAAVFGPRAAG